MAAVVGIVATAFTTFQASALGVFLTQNFWGRLLSSVALSALSSGMAGSPQPAGITTEFTQTGATNPLTFILGHTATGGSMICPPMSHGSAGNTPNAYLTYVINLGDVAGQELTGLIIDDRVVTWATSSPHVDYGFRLEGDLLDFGWIKILDGSQTAADPMLLAKYSDYPERPWSADMIGIGLCMVILTFRYNTKIYSGLPAGRFVNESIPLYDPRFDTTVGGAGPQRWANKATWVPSTNPVVLIYNILRGIEIEDLGTWGGTYEAEDLPLDNWFAAMNECDVVITVDEMWVDGEAVSGTEPAYRAGLEIRVDVKPADMIDELLKACNGQTVDVGGIRKIRVGGPDLPIYFYTDDDVVVSRGQEMNPFPGDEERYNAITAEYPEPENLWEPTPTPPLTNATWEAEDGDQRLTYNLPLPAVYSGSQAQRITDFAINEERRFRRLRQTLPPDAAILEPLDAVSYTSTRHGFAAKVFEVGELIDDTRRLLQGVSLRERDSADYVWTSAHERPRTLVSPIFVRPYEFELAEFTMRCVALSDGTTGRAPAIEYAWLAEGLEGVTGVKWELRLLESGIEERRSTPSGGATLVMDFRQGIYAKDDNGKFWRKDGASLVLDFRKQLYGRDNDWRDPQVQRVTLRGVADPEPGTVVVSNGIIRQGIAYEGRIMAEAGFPVKWTEWVALNWPASPVFA